MPSKPLTPSCAHDTVQLTPSPFARFAGYKRSDARQLAAAESHSNRPPPLSNRKRVEQEAEERQKIFPAPLVLPFDELNLDPECETQSFKEWHDKAKNGGYRNRMERKRGIIYVASVQGGGFADAWQRPIIDEGTSQMQKEKRKRDDQKDSQTQEKDRQTHYSSFVQSVTPDIIEYLSAFYHGMTVRKLPADFNLVDWKPTQKGKKGAIPKYIGLSCSSPTLPSSVTRIRLRSPSPDSLFAVQLNLNDIIDAAIGILPADAHALVLLIDHDMHENEDDDFCCGRAFGKSRVSVVSSARYNPALDERVAGGVDWQHMWPASHCADFVEELCRTQGDDVVPVPSRRKGKNSIMGTTEAGGIQAAISAVSELPPLVLDSSTPLETINTLWFSRLCRTVAHELGHCFGVDHCVYYACSMQGTSGMVEDYRQPPYLCPVCLMKVSYGIACELRGGDEDKRKEYVKERYDTLLKFCESKIGSGDGAGMFVGFAAWLRYAKGC